MNAGSPCGDGGKPNNFAVPCSRKSKATTIRTTLSISGVYFSARSRFIQRSHDSKVDRTNLSKDLWFPARISDHGGLKRGTSRVGSNSTPFDRALTEYPIKVRRDIRAFGRTRGRRKDSLRSDTRI